MAKDQLSGRAAVITGASRGIGAAAARELASQGVAVLLCARSADEINAVAAEIVAAGGRAEALTCDVARYADMAAAVAHCRMAFGRIDILVNNAGAIDPIALLGDSDPEAWAAGFHVNAVGVYHGLRAALPAMAAQQSGVIVNISSGAATNALEGWSQYCAGKAAALMLTRAAHREYAGKGVRVIGLSPGTVATDMQRAIKASGVNPVSQLDWSAHIPAEWPARAIAWLCTADAAEFDGDDVSLRDEAIRRRVGLI